MNWLKASNLDLNHSIYNLFPLSFAKKHFYSVTKNKWELIGDRPQKPLNKTILPDHSDRLAVNT